MNGVLAFATSLCSGVLARDRVVLVTLVVHCHEALTLRFLYCQARVQIEMAMSRSPIMLLYRCNVDVGHESRWTSLGHTAYREKVDNSCARWTGE